MSNTPILKPVWIVYAIILLLLYTVFHNSYMNEYLDNAWTLSWAHGWWTNGSVYDEVFGYLDGDGGSSLFSRSYVFLYGSVATIFGWNRGVALGISSLLIIAAAYLWHQSLVTLEYRKKLAISFALVLLLLEAFYGAAHKARVDALGFFLDSLAFWLFVKKRYLFAGLTLGIAIETHPYAAAGGFWMLAYLFSIRKEIQKKLRQYLRAFLFFVAGLSLGALYWWWLHGEYIIGLSALENRLTSNAWWAYYFNFRYSWRHWPELLMILIALAVFLVRKEGRKKDRFVLPFFVSVVLCSLLIPRGNYHYVVYLYPAAILLILVVTESLNLLPHLLAGILLFQVPQYAWLFYKQRGYHHASYMSELKDRVPRSDLMVYGHPSSWFALHNRDFHAYGYFDRAGISPDQWPDEFLVIENREFSRWGGALDLEKGADSFEKIPITQWDTWDGTPLKIWLMKRRFVGK